MPLGANYMGGKRNAAKARSRDINGRAQKGHFGRQRLNVISQSLFSSKHHAPAQNREPISLAHARRALASLPSAEDRHIRHVYEEIKPSASPVRSASSPRSSRVLEALDINEPISSRATMDRIAALPDLLGLSRPPLRLPERNHSLTKSSSSKKRRFDSSDSDFWKEPPKTRYPSTKRTVISKKPRKLEDDHLTRECTFRDDPGPSSDFNIVDFTSDRDFPDSAFDNDLGSNICNDGVSSPRHTGGLAGTSDISTLCFTQATGPSERCLNSQGSDVSSLGLKDASYPEPTGWWTCHKNSESPMRQERQDITGSATFNLLDYDDPWAEVGRILGLEENFPESQNPSSRSFGGLEVMRHDRSGVGHKLPVRDDACLDHWFRPGETLPSECLDDKYELDQKDSPEQNKYPQSGATSDSAIASCTIHGAECSTRLEARNCVTSCSGTILAGSRVLPPMDSSRNTLPALFSGNSSSESEGSEDEA